MIISGMLANRYFKENNRIVCSEAREHYLSRVAGALRVLFVEGN